MAYCYLFVLFWCSAAILIPASANQAIVEIIEKFDSDGDHLLNGTEFETYFRKLFPKFEHENEAHVPTEPAESGNATNVTHEVHCPSPEELFVDNDLDNSGFLNETEVKSATLVMGLMLTECTFAHEDGDLCPPPTPAESWGYAFLASLLVTLISAVGVTLLPVTKSKIRPYLLNFFLAFAVGSLLGDAILHLFPELHGAHGHGAPEAVVDTHESESPSTVMSELGPSLLICFIMIIFFIVEKILHKIHGRESHIVKEGEDEGEGRGGEAAAKEKKVILPAGYLILIADGIHNFFDGIALGAAFSIGLNVGLVTTLAIFVHEIPQEFGDFVLLIHSGFSRNKAILFNLLSGATSIIGTFIGLGVGALSSDSEKWLLAFVIAAFLYISCVELIPQLHEFANTIPNTVLQVCGCSTGFFIMLILALFEMVPSC